MKNFVANATPLFNYSWWLHVLSPCICAQGTILHLFKRGVESVVTEVGVNSSVLVLFSRVIFSPAAEYDKGKEGERKKMDRVSEKKRKV